MLELRDNGVWSILLPSLALLNLASRHPGLTSAIAFMAAEAASVALDKHHISPQILLIVGPHGELRVDLTWGPVDDRMKRAWNNSLSRTENGAVAVAIAAIELTLGLVVVLTIILQRLIAGSAIRTNGCDWRFLGLMKGTGKLWHADSRKNAGRHARAAAIYRRLPVW